MAITASYVQPATMLPRKNGSVVIWESLLTAGSTATTGQLLIHSSGAGLACTDTVGIGGNGTVLGIVAAGTYTRSTTTTVYTGTVPYYPALQGYRFAINEVADATADITGTYATDILVRMGVTNGTLTACALQTMATATTASVLITLRYHPHQRGAGAVADGKGYGAGVGVLNPRLEAVFYRSAFSALTV